MAETIKIGGSEFDREYCEKLTKSSLLTLARAYYDERSGEDERGNLAVRDIDLGKEWLARSTGKKAAIIAYMFDRVHPISGKLLADAIIRRPTQGGQPILPEPEPEPVQQLIDHDNVEIYPKQEPEQTPDDPLWEMMAAKIKPLIKAEVDIDKFKDYVDRVVAKAAKTNRTVCDIRVTRPDDTTVDVGRQHFMFPLILATCAARVPVYLVGAAGSGKSHLAQSIATALGVPFYSLSCCRTMSVSWLTGYQTATGEYIRSGFRDAYDSEGDGGLMLLDEMDAANANVSVVCNGGLANGHMAFPDRQVKRHPDFIPIAAANTIGLGADRQYVGRNQLDAATLDRFAFVEMPYDWGLTREIAGVKGGENIPPVDCMRPDGEDAGIADYFDFCDKVSNTIDKLKERAICGPRARLYGAKLLQAGIKRKFVENMLIWDKMDAQVAGKIKAAM